jgi:CheY-like chemotaxis protein
MSGDGPALLVVDDNEDNRYTLTRRLRRQGYENITEVENGRDALAALEGSKFDLVLLDVMMPEMNGYETLEHIKSDMATRDIPVIMISALDELESVVRCIEMGAEDYLSKPFNATLLKARVTASLEKKRLRDQEASYLEQLEQERERSDKLLHAILPPGAVQELKATDTIQPRRYEEVAVLFCDIVGFTEYCDRTPPETVVGQLQDLVQAFEGIALSHDLEKIKTIGDAFLATGGLLQKVENPVLACVKCGLEMATASEALEPGWKVRVGIHFGPIVAGIVGQRQFMYDLWGDTVNVAARIAGEADPGTVFLSNEAWLQVRRSAQGRTRGLVPVKGKGELELIECRSVA